MHQLTGERMTKVHHKHYHRVVDKQTVYDGFFKVQRYRVPFQRFDGEWEKPINRELINRPRVAAVLPYDPHLDQVVLIEQFRMGPIKGQKPPWQWEVVAGLVNDRQEPVEQVAHREVAEETGLQLQALHLITQYWLSPGGSDEHVTLYCGFIDASHAGGIWGLDAEHEDIKVSTYTVEQAYQGIQQGWINNATTIIAIQWLKLNHQALKQASAKDESL